MQVKDSNRNRREFAVLAVVCLVLQVAMAPNIGIGNGRANMALVFSGITALMVGGQTGVLCGFLAGLVFDLSTTGPIGLMAFLLTIGSFVVGSEVRNRLADGFRSSMTTFAAFAGVVTLFYHVAMLLVGEASNVFDGLFLRTIPTLVLTMLAFAPFAWYLSNASGSPLTLGRKKKAPRGRGSRYDLGNV